MAIVVLASVSGSPGVTTLAVGLALAWPRSVMLADCDPGAHQAVLAGFLAGQSSGGKGLLRVAEAHRDRRPLREVILDQTLPLVRDSDHERRFLPGFSRPGSAAIFAGVWADLVDAFDELGDIGIDVIVDAGRLGPSGLPARWPKRRPSPDWSSAPISVRWFRRRSTCRSWSPSRARSPPTSRIGLLVVGEGRPYAAGEIGRALAVRPVAAIPWDPTAAGHLSDGRERSRKFAGSAFARALHTTAADLANRLDVHPELIGSRS